MKKEARKLQELIGLAMKVQAETKHCVFVRFSGHVDQLEIDIRESKKNWQDEIATAAFYTDRPNSEERYRNIRNVLLEILETGEFNPDSDRVTQVERVEYDYHF